MKPINVDPGNIIGTKEAARLLQVDERAVRYKIRYGHLSAIKLNGKWILNKNSVLFHRRLLKMKKQ